MADSEAPRKQTNKQSSLVTIFSMYNAMTGTSLLSVPWAVGQAGLGLGVGLLILAAMIAFYMAYRTVKSADNIQNKEGRVIEYADLCKHYLGRPGEICATIFSSLTLVGASIIIWVLMSNFLYNVVLFIFDQATSHESTHVSPAVDGLSLNDAYIRCSGEHSALVEDGDNNVTTSEAIHTRDENFTAYWDLQKTVPFFLVILMAPLIHFKSATFFNKFSALGTISMLYVLGLITYKAAIWGFHFDFDAVPGQYASVSFPALTGVLSLSFNIHNGLPSMLRNQEKPENNARDASIAFSLVALTYMYVGVMFYGSWPLISKSCIDQNLLNNFGADDLSAFIARVFLFIQLITAFPFIVFVLRVQLMQFLFSSVWPSWKHVAILNSCVIGCCLLFASLYPQVGSIIRYTGSVSGLLIIFFIPSAMYIVSEKRNNRLTVAKAAIHILLIAIGLANFISQFLI